MTHGSKEKYTEKQKRKAKLIKESYRYRGVCEQETEEMAWAFMDRESSEGHKSGSGSRNKHNPRPSFD